MLRRRVDDASASFEQNPNRREKVRSRDGFFEDDVTACVERALRVRRRIAGHGDDDDVAGRGVGSNVSAQVQTIHHRHREIGHDDVWCTAAHSVQRRAPVLGRGDFHAGSMQESRMDQSDSGYIVNNENPRRSVTLHRSRGLSHHRRLAARRRRRCSVLNTWHTKRGAVGDSTFPRNRVMLAWRALFNKVQIVGVPSLYSATTAPLSGLAEIAQTLMTQQGERCPVRTHCARNLKSTESLSRNNASRFSASGVSWKCSSDARPTCRRLSISSTPH